MRGGTDVARWLVSKTSGFLDARLDRRSFIARSTMVGTAVAASGCAVVAGPGSPYTYVTDCRGGLCRDGYTEFCCVINAGQNQCPPGTAAAGWWRADGSAYCPGGTRFFVDCNNWEGAGPCRCAAGCGTRKVYCNHFRYGQCNSHIGGTGVIACRLVTCVPPYDIVELNCSPSGAVDHATANHNADCAAYAPPPPPPPPPPVPVPAAPSLGTALSTGAGTAAVIVRAAGGSVSFFDGGSPTDTALGTTSTSKVELVARAGGFDAFTRISDRTLVTSRFDGTSWGAWSSLGGSLYSDPAATISGSQIDVFARGSDAAMWLRRFDGTWMWWQTLGGVFISDPAAATVGGDVWVAGRGTDAAYWVQRFTGSSATGWGALGGDFASDPWLVAFGSSLFVFGRGRDGGAWVRVFNGTAWSDWGALGGVFTSELTAASDGSVLWVFGRGTDNVLYTRRYDGSSWNDWAAVPGLALTTNPEPVIDAGGVSVFAVSTNGELWSVRHDGSTWGSWASLGGVVEPYNGFS